MVPLPKRGDGYPLMVLREQVEIAEKAYRSGQPYMDGLLALLLEKGAVTPDRRAEYLREGLLKESYRNPTLTDVERERIWRRYRVPWLVRLAYRFEAWRTVRRLRREAHAANV
jgi:hypothetical protein